MDVAGHCRDHAAASADGTAAIQLAAVFTYPTWQADRLTPERDDVRRDDGG